MLNPLQLGHPSHDGRNPGRGVTDVFQQLFLVILRQPVSQPGNHRVIHVLLADVAQRLDKQPADLAGGGHGFWGRMLEDDDLFPQLDPAGRTVREENDLHRHLLRQPQQIGGIGAGRLKEDIVTPLERLDNGVRRGREEAEIRVGARVIVQATGQASQGPFFHQAMQCHPDRLTAPQIKEVTWGEHATPAMTINAI